MIIRRSRASELELVRAIHADAFRGGAEPDAEPVEVALLDGLVEAGDVLAPLSLVAVVAGEPLGHVVCSRAWVEQVEVAALGPIAVAPLEQGRGVGSALMHAVLGAADALELPLVALLGSPAYYGRFGFVPAASLGIEAPDRGWGSSFQVRTFAAYDPLIRGRFRYAPAFEQTGAG